MVIPVAVSLAAVVLGLWLLRRRDPLAVATRQLGRARVPALRPLPRARCHSLRFGVVAGPFSGVVVRYHRGDEHSIPRRLREAGDTPCRHAAPTEGTRRIHHGRA